MEVALSMVEKFTTPTMMCLMALTTTLTCPTPRNLSGHARAYEVEVLLVFNKLDIYTLLFRKH